MTIMHCTHCGELLPDSAKFCTSCGQRVQAPFAASIQETAAQEETVTGTSAEEPPSADASMEHEAASALPSVSTTTNGSSSQTNRTYTVSTPKVSNDMAVAGFVCSLILIPVFPIGIITSLLGLILSLVGLSNSRELPERKGRGLAVAGTVISIIRIILRIVALIALLVLMVRGAGYAGKNLIDHFSDILPYTNF